jgi:serine/threonine protein kinase
MNMGRRLLNTWEYGIISELLNDRGVESVLNEDNLEMRTNSRESVASSLKQVLLNENSVHIHKRIGSGAYGDVYMGTCLGQPVALKTMKEVSEESVRLFRAEIVLTSNLRHLNVVGFVGACWGRTLTCLVLEWMAKGSLASFLEEGSLSSGPLRWDDPLLRLVTDIARGMVYLNSREYYDDTDGSKKKCIIHRDLKPDNVLISEFIIAKLSDFGTARVKDIRNGNMTIVGTPLFAAPEVLRGEGEYDEKVDVYSFGMLLLDVAVESKGVDKFIEARWEAEKGNKRRMIRIMNAMIDGEWHPLTKNGGAPMESAPLSIRDLASRCCAFKPSDRPSFDFILTFLTGPAATEVSESELEYVRKPVALQATELSQTSVDSLNAPDLEGAANSMGEESHEQRKSAHHVRAASFAVSPGVRSLVTGSLSSHPSSSLIPPAEPTVTKSSGVERSQVAQSDTFTDM